MIVVVLMNKNDIKYKTTEYAMFNSDNTDIVNYDVTKVKSLAYLIWKGESPRRGANDYNRGSTKCRFSNRDNLKLVDMTISTLKYYQSLGKCTSDVIFAAGWAQIIPSTLKYCQRIIGFGNNEIFSQKLQDIIFVDCLSKYKRPAIYRYIITGKGLMYAARDVAREWASIGSPIHCLIKVKNGRYLPWIQNGGCYNGHGINHHSVHPKDILKALQKARVEFVEQRNLGVEHNKAYASSLGIKNY